MHNDAVPEAIGGTQRWGPMRASLSETFDPRNNSLNAVRLCLALSVIGWHSFPLTGHEVAWAPARQFFGQFAVDGFFAISGFLIASSWVRDPSWRNFLAARTLRILPAYWVCLTLTSFLMAPLVAGAFGWSSVSYVLRNALLWVAQYDIAGTPVGVPYEHVWNGSIWTLWWEFACYLGVLALGVLHLIQRRWTVVILLGAAWLGSLLVTGGVIENNYFALAARFGLMFLTGMLVWRFQDLIPVTPSLLALSSVVLVGSRMAPRLSVVGCGAFCLPRLVPRCRYTGSICISLVQRSASRRRCRVMSY